MTFIGDSLVYLFLHGLLRIEDSYYFLLFPSTTSYYNGEFILFTTWSSRNITHSPAIVRQNTDLNMI